MPSNEFLWLFIHEQRRQACRCSTLPTNSIELVEKPDLLRHYCVSIGCHPGCQHRTNSASSFTYDWTIENTFSATKCQSATSLLLLLFEVSTSGDPAALYFRRAENSDPQTSSDWNCFRNFRRIGKPAAGAVRQSRCVGAMHPLHRRNWRHHSTARPDQQRYPGSWK